MCVEAMFGRDSLMSARMARESSYCAGCSKTGNWKILTFYMKLFTKRLFVVIIVTCLWIF